MAPALFVKAFRHGQYLGLTPAPPREEGAMPMFMVEATVTDEEGNVVHSQTIEAGDEYGGSGTLVQALERVGADGNAKMTAMMEAAGLIPTVKEKHPDEMGEGEDEADAEPAEEGAGAGKRKGAGGRAGKSSSKQQNKNSKK